MPVMRREVAVPTPRPERPPVPVFHGGTGPRPGVDLNSNRALYEALDEGRGLAARADSFLEERPARGSSDYHGDMSEPQPSASPDRLPEQVRHWALGAHLSVFVGAWFALAFLGPLVVWLLKREEHQFIAMHAKEALNFNLSVLIYVIVGVILSFLIIGIPLLIAIGIAWIVLTVIAAVKAENGEEYRYPLTIRFVA